MLVVALSLVCVWCDLNCILDGVVLIIQNCRVFQHYFRRGSDFYMRLEVVDIAFTIRPLLICDAVRDWAKSLQYDTRDPFVCTILVSSQHSCSWDQGTRLGILVMLCFLFGLLRHHFLLCIWQHKVEASTQCPFQEDFVW